MSIVRRVAASAGVLLVAAIACGVGATPSEASGTGQCGSTLRQVHPGKVIPQAQLSCRDISGLDLSDRSLIQITLEGADASKTSFYNDRLIQAKLAGANLSGANLSHTDLSQADLSDADLRGANLAHADLTQADLTGADLTGADISGADITQAQTSGTIWTGVKGVRPWSLYILIGAAAVFVLLAAAGLRRASRRPSAEEADHATPAVPRPMAAGPMGAVAPFGSYRLPGSGLGSVGQRSRGRAVVFALLGALVAALGLHMAAGGLVSAFSFAVDTTATICQQPQCAVGINLGVPGLILGIFVTIFGFAVWSRA